MAARECGWTGVPVRLFQDVGRRTADDDRARLAARAAREADDLVLADHHLLDQLAVPALDHLGVVERRHDLGAEHRGEAIWRVRGERGARLCTIGVQRVGEWVTEVVCDGGVQ